GSIGALGERMNTEVTGLTGSIGALGERMDSEVSGLTGSIGALGERMNTEVTGLTGSIGALGERMDAEVTGLTGSIGALGERMNTEVTGLNGSIGALGQRVDAEVSALDRRMGSLEAETKLITTGSKVIKPSDWTSSGNKYNYSFTSDEISRVLNGNYDVQISFQYAQGTSISPAYGVSKSGGKAYISITVNSLPASNISLDQVVIYYKTP
nr:hypothetical protein [Lachnospiraceae bacterium]